MNNPEAHLHLDQTICDTLGENWHLAEEERFDMELAVRSLSYYNPTSIPKVNPNLPAGVTDVHFRSDLSAIAAVSLNQYRAFGGLFHALPRQS